MSGDSISIKLTKGQFAIIEPVDADIAQLKWYAAHFPAYANGGNYVARRTFYNNGNPIVLQMHRVILGRILNRELESHEICDHINGNPLDNRRSNLRLATRAQSARNVAKNRRNTTGYKGVTWSKREKKYRAAISVNGKTIQLGSFDDPVLAYEAYKIAAKKYHEEFARFE